MKEGGFSILEVILAAGLFIIMATGAVTIIINGYNANRLGLEMTVANQFASEGIEAVKSIKNQAYTGLVNTNGCSLNRVSNVWVFDSPCATDTLVHNSGDNFIRTLKVEDVRRDAAPPAGNIVAAGGTLDPDTKKITSTVTWNFSAARPETISLVSYLSDWRKPIGGGGGVLAYLDNTSTVTDDQPEYRMFNDSSGLFGAKTNMTTAFTEPQDAKSFKIKSSPTKQEAIVGYVTNGGVLRIMCFDGNTWTSEWTVTVGGNGTNNQRFGIAYETQTGDVLVVYSRNVATTNEMAYRTKPGSSGCGSANWPAATNIDSQRTSGVVSWVRMEGNPISSSNNIAVAWEDANQDLSAMQWTGSSFGIAEPASALETNLDWAGSTSGANIQSFDIAFENLTGNLMIAWGLATTDPCAVGSTCIRYARYTGSWLASTGMPTITSRATTIDLSGNPNSNEIVMGAMTHGTGGILSIGYWSGSAWTGIPNADGSGTIAAVGNKLVATGWLTAGATTRSVVVFVNSGTQSQRIHGFVGNGASFARQGTPIDTTPWFTPTPLFANPPRWLDIQMNPKSPEKLILTLSDNGADLHSKQLVMAPDGTFTSPNGWSNTEVGGVALETVLGQATTSPFSFAYWRNP